ncbi:hypothetical protein [Vreelandella sp. EE22]
MKSHLPTVALGVANAVLLAVVAWVATTSAEPRWLAVDAQPAFTSEPLPVELQDELDQARRDGVRQRPIFSPERQPDPDRAVVTANPLSDVALTAIFQEGETQWVYLDEPGKAVTRLDRGETLDNGWTLEQLSPQTATFVRQGQTQTLSLPMRRLPPPSKATTLTLP